MGNWSLKTWVLLVSFIVTVAFLYFVREALAPFVIALVLVYLLNPVVNWLVHLKIKERTIPRLMAVLIVMGVLLGGLTALISYLVPALAQEVKPIREAVVTYYFQIANQHLPDLVVWLQNAADKAAIRVNVQETFEQALQKTFNSDLIRSESLVHGIQDLISGLFSALFGVTLVFILTVFLLLDWPRIRTGFWNLIPESHRTKIARLVEELDQDLSGSIRGQLTICFINFVLTTLGLLLLKVKYAVTLGVIAGVFSIVPVFGSIASTVPMVLVSLTVSFVMALKAVAVIIVIHLIEANVLNPKVMGHHVELPPVLIMLAIVIGEYLFGPIGLVVGVPVAAALRSILSFGYELLVQEPEPVAEGVGRQSGAAGLAPAVAGAASASSGGVVLTAPSTANEIPRNAVAASNGSHGASDSLRPDSGSPNKA